MEGSMVTLEGLAGRPGAGGQFDAAIQALDVGVLIQDLDGRALASNPAAQRILGLSAAQLGGREPLARGWSILHEDGWPLPTAELPSRIALRSGRVIRDVLLAVKHPDARVTWVRVNANPITDDGATRPHAVVVSVTDVTASRAAAAAEHRSHDRFRSLIEHSSDVVTIMDERGRVTYESPAVEAVLGYAPGELVGPGRLARVHPDDVAEAGSAVTRLTGRPGESVSCEYRIKARDGSWRILESVATNRLHDPAVVGIVINTRDVTERRETEAALRATTTRLEYLVQNLHGGVMVEDEERQVLLVNTEMLLTFGVTEPPEAMAGTSSQEGTESIAHLLADAEGFVERVEEVVAAAIPVRAEEMVFADGRTFERDYIPILSDGVLRGHMWLYRDVSRRKDEEREAARLRDEAIRSARAKSEFLTTLSHEIRTPVNGVLATVELLLDSALEPHQRELAGLVRDASRGLLTVVDDTLDLSKLDADKLEPREVDLDVAAVAEGVGDVVLSAARSKGLAVSVYVDPRIPQRLRGDAQWLRQVLVNLAGNAVKFTTAGDVRIRAELVLQGSGSSTVRFSVKDTGVGIPPSAHERLFEPFVQLEAGEQQGGTGLGLAICRRLVALMGGELEVASSPGRGSEFSFLLELPAGAPPRAAGPRGLRVLLVEPSDDVAYEYLGAWGVEAERAASADAARKLAAGGARFDAAVLGIEPSAAAALAADLHELDAGMRLILVKDVGAPAPEPAVFTDELTRPLKQSGLYEAVVGSRLPRGLRVLVADDDEVNRELLVRQLAKLGVQADAVTGGHEAVEAMGTAGLYDAVLMDSRMPGLDGIRAARMIRALPGGSVPIIGITGGDADEWAACLDAGMDDCLRKPISSGDLTGALGRIARVRVIDSAALERLEADLGDRDELRRIAGIYLTQLEEGVRAIASAGGNAVRQAAHRLASASATFGAGRVADLCRALEADPSAPLTASLEAESARAADELRRLLELD